MNEDLADMLDGLDLFKRFSYRELQTFCRYLRLEEKKKGEAIFLEGDPGTEMLILTDGRMAVSKGGADGGPHLLSYEGKGRIIGEMALLDQERRSATCIADTDCTLLCINAANLERMAQDYPPLAYKFMFTLAQLLSKRLRRTSGVLAEFLVG